jgi:hypothetical protein
MERKYAVGSEAFVDQTKARPGIRAAGRKIHETGQQFELREAAFSYKFDFGPKNTIIDAKNTYFWKHFCLTPQVPQSISICGVTILISAGSANRQILYILNN